jgi:hypothetical protein
MGAGPMLKVPWGDPILCTWCSQLSRKLTRIQLGLECLDFGILGYRRLLHFAGKLCLGKLDRIALVLLGQLKALIQLLPKSAVANLLQNVCVAGLVDFECFAAVGADDFIHVCPLRFYSFLPMARCQPTPISKDNLRQSSERHCARIFSRNLRITQKICLRPLWNMRKQLRNM